MEFILLLNYLLKNDINQKRVIISLLLLILLLLLLLFIISTLINEYKCK